MCAPGVKLLGVNVADPLLLLVIPVDRPSNVQVMVGEASVKLTVVQPPLLLGVAVPLVINAPVV